MSYHIFILWIEIPELDKKELKLLLDKILNEDRFLNNRVEKLGESVRIFYVDARYLPRAGRIIGEYHLGATPELFKALEKHIGTFSFIEYSCGMEYSYRKGEVIDNTFGECKDRIKDLERREQKLEKCEEEMKKWRRFCEAFGYPDGYPEDDEDLYIEP